MTAPNDFNTRFFIGVYKYNARFYLGEFNHQIKYDMTFDLFWSQISADFDSIWYSMFILQPPECSK